MEINSKISGSDALLRALEHEGVDTIFGYPGGAIMPVYDRLPDHALRHILVRHEQGAIHAAQGYARACGRPGVVLVTSGPGATNVITGVADANMDSTPVIVINGQVPTKALGTDAFQEVDMIGLTSPITKWNYQIRSAEDIPWAVSRAFYVATTGRPGPVVLDFTKDAQIGLMDFHYEKMTRIRTYNPCPTPSEEAIDEAVRLLDSARRPFVVFGQGIILSGAEKQLSDFLQKGDIPAGATMLGLSALPSDDRHYMGMIGMHGNIAPNIKTNECDVLLAVGMRFDDRVTGVVEKYAHQAKVIHIDIDIRELGKIIPADVQINGDAAQVLSMLTERIRKADRSSWIESFSAPARVERIKVADPEVKPAEGPLRMGEIVEAVAELSGRKAVIVTDVGQNQLIAARYSKFTTSRSFITSGGLGTMGFGLPAAIGAKTAVPGRPVVLFVGDGGIQMTLQELGTIMQEGTGVKVIVLDNNWLGNVRQWQEMFFGGRYSQTRMLNPDYEKICSAYGIKAKVLEAREDLTSVISEMLSDDKPYFIDAHVIEEGTVMPMIPPGQGLDRIMLNKEEWYDPLKLHENE